LHRRCTVDVGKVAVGGVDLILVVIGLMEFAKKLGLAGKPLVISAFCGMLVFGAVAGAISQGLVPEVALPWIQVVVYALGVAVNGAAAMGLYDVAQKFRPTVIEGELLEARGEWIPCQKRDVSGTDEG